VVLCATVLMGMWSVSWWGQLNEYLV